MPVTTDTLRKMPTVNKLFAVSGLLLLGSIIWLIRDDFKRPWKEYQEEYMDNQVSLYHLDALLLKTEDKEKELAVSKTKVDEEKAQLDKRQDEIIEIQNAISATQGKFQSANLQYGNLNGTVGVLRADFEHAKAMHGPDSHEAEAALKTLEEAEGRLEKLKTARDQIEDANRRLEAKLKSIRRPYEEAQKEYSRMLRDREETEQKSADYASQLRRKVFNMPLADFAAPRGEIGRFEIKQQVLHDVRFNVNFMDTYVVDRCQTCHMAIDDPRFSVQGLTEKFVEAGSAINQELARRGAEPIPFPAPPKPEEGKEKPSADKLAAYHDELEASVNEYLKRQGLPEIHVDEPLLAHPDLDLYIRPDSPHPVAKMGCTSCHDGNGYETDFVLAAHTPPDHHTHEEWNEEYVRWYGSTSFETVEHYWDYPMTVPKYIESNCTKCHSQITDMLDFDGEPIASTINTGRYLFTSVGCANCHLVKGLDDARRVGPDLTHVASKLTPEFIAQWTWFPKDYRPSTWMPHFFQQENNVADSAQEADPDPVARTKAETAAMAYYLTKVSRPFEPEAMPADLTADAEAGRDLFTNTGCLACHGALAHHVKADGPSLGEAWITKDLQDREGLSSEDAAAEFAKMNYSDQVVYAMKHLANNLEAVFDPPAVGERPMFTRFAPELSSIATKFRSEDQGMHWLYDWLRNPRHYSSYTKMPSLRLTPQEALDLSAYLLTLNANSAFAEQVAETDLVLDSAARDEVDYLMTLILGGQNSKARTEDIMNDVGGELTGLLVAGLRKSIGEDDARALVDPLSLADKRAFFVGSKSINHYGCYACHSIPGFETAVRPGTELTEWGIKELSKLDYGFYHPAHDAERDESFEPLYPEDDEKLIFWSTLGDGEEPPHQDIMHTRASFAWHKMKNPRIWDRKKLKDPLSKVKMPNYFFTDEQADAVVTYLLSRRPGFIDKELTIDYEDTAAGPIAAGRQLTRELNCVGCHKIENNIATVHQYIYEERAGGRRVFSETNAPPWLRGEGAKVQHEWFYGFLNNVEMLRPWLKVRMPSFYVTNDQAATLVEYFAMLSNKESEQLDNLVDSVAKYINDAHHAAGGIEDVNLAELEQDAGDYKPRPGDDWYTKDSLAAERKRLVNYAVRNSLLHPSELSVRDPNDPVAKHEQLSTAYYGALRDAAFLRELYETNYPFVNAFSPPMNEDRYDLGVDLFYELQCLKCHVFGDPSIPGALRTPTAPNLNLTHRRLQPDWVMAWLAGPGRIQPGTKMPMLWPGGASYFAEFPEPDKSELQSKYGAGGDEQMRLITDTLFEAGRQNETLVQPGAAEMQKLMDEAAQESGDDDDWGDEGDDDWGDDEGGGDDDWDD